MIKNTENNNGKVVVLFEGYCNRGESRGKKNRKRYRANAVLP